MRRGLTITERRDLNPSDLPFRELNDSDVANAIDRAIGRRLMWMPVLSVPKDGRLVDIYTASQGVIIDCRFSRGFWLCSDARLKLAPIPQSEVIRWRASLPLPDAV
jgi:hypothetical protein